MKEGVQITRNGLIIRLKCVGKEDLTHLRKGIAQLLERSHQQTLKDEFGSNGQYDCGFAVFQFFQALLEEPEIIND